MKKNKSEYQAVQLLEKAEANPEDKIELEVCPVKIKKSNVLSTATVDTQKADIVKDAKQTAIDKLDDDDLAALGLSRIVE